MRQVTLMSLATSCRTLCVLCIVYVDNLRTSKINKSYVSNYKPLIVHVIRHINKLSTMVTNH